MKINKFSKFFGNRFAAKREAILSAVTRDAAVAMPLISEFEVLESRVLLSGIGTGVDQKRVQFTDADGDLVTVSARGEGASFIIQLVGGVDDGADIESITVQGEGASLGVSVAPQGFETDRITPGFSTIGQITAAAGVSQLGSISLSAAVASKIDLGDAEVGSISLTTGQTAKVDALTGGGFEGALSQEQISFQTISTGSVGALRLSGGADGTNNFQGNITATIGDIGQLWGPNSTMFGNLHFGGADAALGSVNLGGGFDYGTQISADGNFTFLADGFDGSINVEGHLNFGVGELGVIGDIYAGGGVSGLKASTQDALLIGGVFSADLQTIGDIADVRLTGAGYLDNAVIEAVNIGTISSRGDGVGLGYGNIIRASGDLAGIELRRASLIDGNTFDVSGQIGEIDIINGNLDGLLTAGSFGEVRVSNGSIYGSLVALAGDIGRVEVKEGSIYGSIQALQGGIGEVSALTSQNWTALGGKISAQFIGPVSATNLGDGFAIGGSDMQVFATDDIAGITAITNGAVAVGDYASVQAGGALGDINVTALSTYSYDSAAISNVYVQADSIGAITVASSTGQGIAYSEFVAVGGDIGPISITSRTGGITESSFTSYKGAIGNLNITNLGPKTEVLSSRAVSYSAFDAGTSIGAVSVISGGAGLYNADFMARNGSIGDVTIDAVTEGIGYGSSFAAAFAATGAPPDPLPYDIYNIFLPTADGGHIGSVTVLSRGAYGSGYVGINGASFAAGGSIGNVRVESAGEGIRYASFASEGNIGLFSVISKGSDGNAYNAMSYSSVSAENGSIGGIAINSAGTGVYESDFSAGGDIGSIDVQAADFAVVSYNYGSSFTAGGSIGDISIVSTGANVSSYTAIYNTNFSAKAGIGDISIESVGEGMRYASFVSGGNIGLFSVTSKGSNGNAYAAMSYSSVSAENGSIRAVTINSSGAGVYQSNFNAGGDIGSIDVKAGGTGVGGMSGYNSGSSFTAGGSIGSISVISAGQYGSGYAAVYNADFNAGEGIGSINVESAGEGMRNASFNAGGEIGTVNILSQGVPYGGTYAAVADSSFASTGGSIGAVSVTSAGDGLHAASFKAAIGIIDSVEIKAGATGIIDSSFSAGAAIGNVSVTAAGDGIASASLTSGSISAITINSGYNSRLTLNASQVGSITSLGNTVDSATLTLDLGPDTRSLGPVTVGANLEIVGDSAALENLGAAKVGGSITLNTSLASVQNASTINAATILGGQTVGTGSAGSSIGLVTITNGDPSANSVTFNFASMNGVSNATAGGTVVVDFLNGSEPDITAFDATLAGGATSAGVTAILV
jgi:hypothetical protein